MSRRSARFTGIGRFIKTTSFTKAVLVVVLLAGLVAAAVLLGAVKELIAVLVAYVILRIGLGMLRGLARPPAEPPEPGQLRKVRLHYHCSICGTEVRMTVAPDEDPEAPRHCQDEMDLMAPIE